MDITKYKTGGEPSGGYDNIENKGSPSRGYHNIKNKGRPIWDISQYRKQGETPLVDITI